MAFATVLIVVLLAICKINGAYVYSNYDKLDDISKQDDTTKYSNGVTYYTVSKPQIVGDTKKMAVENVYSSPVVEYQTISDDYRPDYVLKKATSYVNNKPIYTTNQKFNFPDQYQTKPISSYKTVPYDEYKIDTNKKQVDLYKPTLQTSYYQPVAEGRKAIYGDGQNLMSANNFNSIYIDNQKPPEYLTPTSYTKSSLIEYQKPDEVYVSRDYVDSPKSSWSVKQIPKTNSYNSKNRYTNNNKQVFVDTGKPAMIENNAPYYVASQNSKNTDNILPKPEHEVQSYIYSQIPKHFDSSKYFIEFPEKQMTSYFESQVPKLVEYSKPTEYYKPAIVEQETPYYVDKSRSIVAEKSKTGYNSGVSVLDKLESENGFHKKPKIVEQHSTMYINNNQPGVIEQTVVDSSSCSDPCGHPIVWAKDVPIPKKFKDLSFLNDLDKDKSKSGASASASAKTVVNIASRV